MHEVNKTLVNDGINYPSTGEGEPISRGHANNISRKNWKDQCREEDLSPAFNSRKFGGNHLFFPVLGDRSLKVQHGQLTSWKSDFHGRFRLGSPSIYDPGGHVTMWGRGKHPQLQLL